MRESFSIKYSFDSSEGFDLALLGSSFVGFDKLVKELLLNAGLEDKVAVRTTAVRQGSVEVLNTVITLGPTFIQDPKHLIDFLRLAGPHLISGVNTFVAVKNNLNDYYAKRPVDFQIEFLVAAYIVKSIYVAGKTKLGDKAAIESSDATPKQISRLRKMVNKGVFRRALAPITQGSVSEIKVSSSKSQKPEDAVVISETNVGDFLPDDEQILPEFKDGDRIPLTGELQLLGSTHGDTMKIKIRDIDPDNNLLDARPVEGLDIVKYSELFKQAVFVDAQIQRKSMFKKPTLLVFEMTALQEKLNLVIDKTSKPEEIT